jgi:hypothetical protein
MLSARANHLRALELAGPEWIPAFVDIHEPAWLRHGRAMEAVVLRPARLFPDYRSGSFPSGPTHPFSEVYGALRDDWGCVWRNLVPGIIGQVVGHPRTRAGSSTGARFGRVWRPSAGPGG